MCLVLVLLTSPGYAVIFAIFAEFLVRRSYIFVAACEDAAFGEGVSHP
ncbi:hypothetical protein APTSU1_000679200 [Apodemus speciosus]|uniref:Uncharacterized protein n=1 Tax=Apodemus speciosus TaxID=105296 RepID=A0ABQ0EXD4_APOSI